MRLRIRHGEQVTKLEDAFADLIADKSKQIIRREYEALEAGIVFLVNAGVDVNDIEICHDVYSDPVENHLLIHSRTYVRSRKK